MTPLLFEPLALRGVTLPNRIVLAPLGQYSATDGFADDWHLVHLGKFAVGGMGVVMTEATTIEPVGRFTHGDLGIWSDDHVPGLKRIADFVRREGAVSAIQIAHSGRKGARQRPWQGNDYLAAAAPDASEPPWEVVGASALPVSRRVPPPRELSIPEIQQIIAKFGQAAARADAAGFDIVEIHAGHGYLISGFLSPSTNIRTDAYGGDFEGRARLALEIASEVRQYWPSNKPLFYRISAVDDDSSGWSIEDSVQLSKALKARGVDIIDCSSGGLSNSPTLANTKLGLGYQVGYAHQIRRDAEIGTMAVGLILDGAQAEAILQAGSADLIAIGRQAMYDPYWAHHAAHQLGYDLDFKRWAPQAGWWLDKRARSLPDLFAAAPDRP